MDTKATTATTGSTATRSTSTIRLEMADDSVTELKILGVRKKMSPAAIVEGWVREGKPVTAVTVEQPAAGELELRLATVTEERDSLKKQLGEVKKQLSAAEKKVTAGVVGSAQASDSRLAEERDQLAKDVERLEKELKLSASERTRIDLELKRVTAENAQLKATGGKGEPESVVVARQAAQLEKAWRERDAARDELATYKNRVGKLDAEIASLKAERAKP